MSNEHGRAISEAAARRFPSLCVYCACDTERTGDGHVTAIGDNTICTDCAVSLRIPTECCGNLWISESEREDDV